ncbi:MAG: glycosyltransferase family 39 protein [Gemmatimonadetes bacterium]|nr:glycosyltransferase family 39 protein [Gemmatimonadota bacterium]
MPSRETVAGRVTAMEWLLLVGAVVVGALLRGWQADTLALTHFDEGVYAFSGYGIATGRDPALFPDQIKFSPPVYFTLVAAANLLGVTPELAPFAVSIVVGVLTIPVLWWLVRGWFGAISATAATWFLAMNEFHVLMSRTALTDVTFALVFLLALGAVRFALERGTMRAAVLAGIPVGLAWHTKYHGWFALVIAAMVIGGQWRLQGRGWPATRNALVRWLVMSVVALACYLPWMAFIQSQPGSSAGWVSYFATMLRLDWFGNFWQQVQQQGYLEGPWTRASAVAALVAAQLVAMGQSRSLAPWVPMGAAGIALLVGGAAVPVVLMGAALAIHWRRGMTTAAWVLTALVVLWVVMAPVYHPYFRLLLPLAVTWFALGGAGVEALARPTHRPWPSLAVAAVALGLVGVLSPRMPDPSSPWRASRGLVEAAEQLSDRVPVGEPISVMGEPALAFYLHRRGHPAWERGTLEALDTLATPRYLVTGIYQRRAPLIQKRFEERADQLELLARFPAGLPSDLRLLDNFLPDSARVWMTHPDTTYDLLLYRFTPRGARRP